MVYELGSFLEANTNEFAINNVQLCEKKAVQIYLVHPGIRQTALLLYGLWSKFQWKTSEAFPQKSELCQIVGALLQYRPYPNSNYTNASYE